MLQCYFIYNEITPKDKNANTHVRVAAKHRNKTDCSDCQKKTKPSVILLY